MERSYLLNLSKQGLFTSIYLLNSDLMYRHRLSPKMGILDFFFMA